MDALTGKDYEHRRQWVEDRILFLGEVFCIDVLSNGGTVQVVDDNGNVIETAVGEDNGDGTFNVSHSFTDSNVATGYSGLVSGYEGDSDCGCRQLTGDAARAFIQGLQNARNNLISVDIWRTAGIKTGMVAGISNVFIEDSSQNEKKLNDAPSGILDIDKAKKKYGWDKDKVHGIKAAAHGGMVNGKSWTGVAPDGTVGINEGGSWSPQGHWTDLL